MLFQHAHTLNGGTAGAAHSIFQYAGVAAAFQHHAGAAQKGLGGIFLGFGAGQSGSNAAVGQCFNKLIYPRGPAAGNTAGGVDQIFRDGIQPPGRGHGTQKGEHLVIAHAVSAVLDHTGPQRNRGVGHDADDWICTAGHLAHAGHAQPRSHSNQDKTPAALCQDGGDAGQHIGHHLRLYAKENYIAVLRDHIVGGGAAAKCFGQGFSLGRGAVGQHNIFRPNAAAHCAGNRTAHVAAADKTITHRNFLPLL